MTDTSIVKILLKDNFTDIYEELEKSGGSLYLNNVINKWLLSLFIQGISDTYFYFIWDMFLLEGNIIIFKTIYAMIIILEDHIIKCKTFDQLNNVFNNIPMTLNERGKLAYYLISKKFNFNMEMIRKYRKTLNSQIIKEIVDLGFFQNNVEEEEEEETDEKKEKEDEQTNNNKNKKKIICDLDWPLCLKDKKTLEKDHNHIILKQLDEPFVIDNYIDNYEQYQKQIKRNSLNINEENKLKYFKEKRFKDLLIERKKHYCGSNVMSIRSNFDVSSFDIKFFNSQRKISVDLYYNEENDDLNNIERNKTINKIINDITYDNQNIISFVKENVEKGLLK